MLRLYRHLRALLPFLPLSKRDAFHLTNIVPAKNRKGEAASTKPAQQPARNSGSNRPAGEKRILAVKHSIKHPEQQPVAFLIQFWRPVVESGWKSVTSSLSAPVCLLSVDPAGRMCGKLLPSNSEINLLGKSGED